MKNTKKKESATYVRGQKKISVDEIHEYCLQNQDGDAELFKYLNSGRFCFDHSDSSWYRWNEHFWVEDLKCEHIAAIKNVIELYAKAAKSFSYKEIIAQKNGNDGAATSYRKKCKELKNRISQLHTLQRKKQIIELATLGEHGLGVTGTEWDQEPMLLACANGVVDLKTGNLIQGSQKQYLKTACPIEYHPETEYPATFLQFLEHVFDGNKDLIGFVQRLLGYSLIGEVREHIFPIFCGQGRNGKGTLLQIVSHVLGPLAGPVAAELLLDQGKIRSSAGPSPDIVDMRGKRFVWASETNEGNRLDIARVKYLVGGDARIGRAMYAKSPIRYIPTDTLFLLTNHKPRVTSDDYAFWNRVLVIQFNLSFVDDPKLPNERKADKLLAEKLKMESEGILKWLVDGCIEYQRTGLNPPDEVRSATESYRENEDTLGNFINECLIIKTTEQIKAGDLYRIYQQWCERNGHHYLNQTNFGRKMGERFDKYRQSGNVFYIGISEKEP